MDLSIIVVSYNTRELLAQCLCSIEATAVGMSYEVIVVDNGSTDGSPEMVAELFPCVRLIKNRENRGFSGANNQAIEVSSGRLILLLNSDAILLCGAVRSMVSYMDEHPAVGVAGGQLLNPDMTFQGSYADFPSLRGEMLLMTKLSRLICPSTYPCYPSEMSQEERSVDWVSGACLVARRAAIEDVGPLDEGYFMYGEETDWCYRMHGSGWEVHYLPQARVIHWSGQSASRSPETKRSQLYRSKWLFMRKHRGAVVASVYYLAVQVASVLKLLMWIMGSATLDRARRKFAIQQAHSYVLLLKRW